MQKGDKISIIDDLSTGGIEKIQHLKGWGGFKYIPDKIMNKQVMTELVDAADVVMHLAAAVGVRLIVESPVHTIKTNLPWITRSG